MSFHLAFFQIRDINGRLYDGQIEDLSILMNLIHEHGLEHITKVSFYFEGEGSRGGIWNCILRNRNGKFHPEFTGSMETWERDWSYIMNVLHQVDTEDVFVHHCISLL